MTKKFNWIGLIILLSASLNACEDNKENEMQNGSEITEKETNILNGNTPDGVRTIDLGLSVNFADRNIGANDISDVGIQFAWGEPIIKESFSLDNYFDRDYTIVTKNIFGTEYDIASVAWGNKWRMMSKREFNEMRDQCTVETVTTNGKIAMKITGPNGNTILMPYSYKLNGYYDIGIWTGDIMRYVNPEYCGAYIGAFINYAIDGPEIVDKGGDYRYKGYYVRTVCDK